MIETPHPADAARDYTASLRLALVPIPPVNGKPTKGPTTKGWNNPENVILDPEAAARYWTEHPDHNMGALLEDSGIVSFDVDDLDATRRIFDELGIELEALLAGAPRIVGAPGHDKALFAAPEGVSLGTHKLTWPDRDGRMNPKTGKLLERTVFELRAGRVQDVLPPSLHPDTGKPYTWRVTPNGQFPPLPPELLELWVNWPAYEDMLKELCPWAKPKARSTPKRGKDGVSVIAAFNQAHDVRSILETHGYKAKGQRFLPPDPECSIPGVVMLEDGKVYSHHTDDPLSDGHAHDAFDVYRILEHGGDDKKAVKAAAELLGLDFRGPEPAQEPRSASTPDDDLTPITVCLADVRPEPIRWLWPGRFALGKVSIIAGDPGLGKSLVTLAMSAAVSTGGLWPDGAQAPAGEVILLTAEDDLADTIRPRLDAAGADVRRVHALTMIREVDLSTGEVSHRAFSLKRDLARLAKLLMLHPGCTLVVVDPISSYLDGTDSHNNAEVRGALTPLADLAARHRVAVVSVSHLNKGMNTSVMYRTMGSLAFVAQARAAYAVVKDKDNDRRRLMLPIKNNLAEDSSGLAYTLVTADNGAVVVAWESEPVTLSADEALAPAPREEDGERHEREEAKDWLIKTLSDGPVRVKDIQTEARDAGINWRTLVRAKADLGIVASKQAFSGGWQWELPKSATKSATFSDVAPFDQNSAASASATTETPKNATSENVAPFVASFEAPEHVDNGSWLGHWVRNRKTRKRGRVIEDRGDTLHVQYADGAKAWLVRSEMALYAAPSKDDELPAPVSIEGELLSTDEGVSRYMAAWQRHRASCTACRPPSFYCDEGAQRLGDALEEGMRRDAQQKAGMQVGDIPTFEDLHGERGEDDELPASVRIEGERDAATTRVVHVREPFDIYIGREWKGYINGEYRVFPQSDWANPFPIGKKHGPRAEVIRKFEAWIRQQPELMARLPELRSRVLGCWCAPERCHGDVLLKLVAELSEQEGGR